MPQPPPAALAKTTASSRCTGIMVKQLPVLSRQQKLMILENNTAAACSDINGVSCAQAQRHSDDRASAAAVQHDLVSGAPSSTLLFPDFTAPTGLTLKQCPYPGLTDKQKTIKM